MNAIELLKKDHRTVESLFESFEKAKEKEQDSSKREIFASIKEELDAHARVEEEVFYPAFDQAARDDDDKELVLEAGEEHKQVKTLLAELEGLDPDDETFDAKMKVLKDNVEHHVKEEEGEMFPHAQKQLGSEELDELGSRISALKESIQQQPAAPAAERAATGRKSTPSAARTRTATPRRRSGGRSSAARTSPRGSSDEASIEASSSGLLESMGVDRKSPSAGTARSRSRSSRGRSSSGRSSGKRASSGRSTSRRGGSSSSGRSSTNRRPSSSQGASKRRASKSRTTSSRSAASRRSSPSSRKSTSTTGGRGRSSGRSGSRGRSRSSR
jgi:hemerythrin superfamily protein